MAKADLKAVIFDFAGVIGVDGYWAWLRLNVPKLEGLEPFFHRISEQVDRAEITEVEFVTLIGKSAGVSPDQVRSEILDRIKIDRSVVALIEQVKKTRQTALLSNFIHDWLRPLLETHDLYRLFDAVVISTEVRMAKPDKAIFLQGAEMLGRRPEECVFIDDRQMHVEGAKAAGMQALLFESAEKLREDLAALALL